MNGQRIIMLLDNNNRIVSQLIHHLNLSSTTVSTYHYGVQSLGLSAPKSPCSQPLDPLPPAEARLHRRHRVQPVALAALANDSVAITSMTSAFYQRHRHLLPP